MKLAATALVAALFAMPLFAGLGEGDYQNDEAIYAYAVDRMLETGEFLTPVSIPHENAPFLEKPPLKFWIVALPISLGVLPHDEFGMRFWDAVFGAAAFFYVLAIGWRLGGPLAGIASVMMLFTHRPLLFEHGLRTHNMEAALVLSYCGGVYHFLAWQAAGDRAGKGLAPGPATPGKNRTAGEGRRAGGEGGLHVFAIALWFVLGFMTKFVAALFLPLVLAAAALVSGRGRRLVARDWRRLLLAGLLAAALIAPWFAYQHARSGSELWRVMFGTHVVTRFTGHLDAMHLNPANYYVTEMVRHLRAAGTLPVTLAGLVLLAWVAARGRQEAVVVLAWLAIPLAAISSLSSKLYHYAYPFVPPLAIAAGYAAALAAFATWIAVRRIAPLLLGKSPAGTAHPAPESAPGGSRVPRPARRAATLVAATLFVALLPLGAYRRVLSALDEGRHPLRSTGECLARVAALNPGPDGSPPGVWAEGRELSHIFFYYLRRLGPYVERDVASDPTVFVHLYAPWQYRPVLLSVERYAAFMRLVEERDKVTIERAARKAGIDPATLEAEVGRVPIAMLEFPGETLLMPGPFAVCGEATNRATKRRRHED